MQQNQYKVFNPSLKQFLSLNIKEKKASDYILRHKVSIQTIYIAKITYFFINIVLRTIATLY